MADKEATRKIGEAILVCRTPDVCKTPMGSSMVPVPYQIISKFETATKTATTVNFTGEPAFNMGSYLPTVIGDEAGVGGGLKTGSHKGKCYPLTHSTSVRVQGQWLVRHDDLFEMNCSSPGNTIGKVVYDIVVSKETLSTVLDAIPVVGTVKGAGQLITGKDLVTGEPVNRWIEAAGLVASLIPGGKGAVSGGKAIVKGVAKETAEKAAKEAAEKAAKELAEKAAKEAAEKAAKEAAEKAAKEAAEKAAKEGGEELGEKAAKSTAQTGSDGAKVKGKGKKKKVEKCPLCGRAKHVKKYRRSMSERRKALLRDANDPKSKLSDKARDFIKESDGKNVPQGYEVSHEEPLYTKPKGKRCELDVADNMKTQSKSEHRARHKECGDQFRDFPPEKFRF
ncbi:pre-toxin TG domain-containing protein [bacterium]|nr:pre-toxin TG domain-containing protein [bacterium]